MNRLEPEINISFVGMEHLDPDEVEEMFVDIGKRSQQAWSYPIYGPDPAPPELRWLPALIVRAVRFLLYRGAP